MLDEQEIFGAAYVKNRIQKIRILFDEIPIPSPFYCET
jgi:hypothetical protein